MAATDKRLGGSVGSKRVLGIAVAAIVLVLGGMLAYKLADISYYKQQRQIERFKN
jgi:hypothetical protein